MIDAYSELICGKVDIVDPYGGVINHLKDSIKVILSEISTLKQQTDTQVALYGPFLGRSILELSFASLIGRLDPFRILVLREMQIRLHQGSGQRLGQRFQSSIQWSGDIRPMEKEPNEQEMWLPNKAMEKINRTLFGCYYNQIFWTPAFIAVIDALGQYQGSECQGDWFDELKLIKHDEFINRIKGEADRTYSALSKGIHHEFVIPTETIYSRETVFSLLEATIRVTAHAGLVSNAIRSCQYSLPLDHAIKLYKTIQDSEK